MAARGQPICASIFDSTRELTESTSGDIRAEEGTGLGVGELEEGRRARLLLLLAL